MTQSYGWNLQRMQHSRISNLRNKLTYFIRCSVSAVGPTLSDGARLCGKSARLSSEVPRRVVRSDCGCCRTPSTIRSASRGLLNFPRYNVSNYGRRAFCFAGPYVWNSLPEHIRQSISIAVFKRSLKTLLILLQQIWHLAS